ncbi:hypothetical protein AYL99_04895 [Fonsecaea erecta]|uniref:Uncharacterized protein n=1 Tax=Fonsecaea erecta TaxID=1367422 RepID=A0A178ZL06_9EURO|nr:hypothetical protein AYL99_04895 [Fonsecaea erecta]OAP59893.1 hypothetical protein AYL99_04895 [Fonsecaea erecta]
MALLNRSIEVLEGGASNLQAWCSLGRSRGKKEASSVEAQANGLVELPLSGVPLEFSFSSYLSPKSVPFEARPTVIIFKGRPLDATYLVLLALNEECHRMRPGCFYHLSLRRDVSKGHPCDMVFIDEPGGEKSVKTWDASSWD